MNLYELCSILQNNLSNYNGILKTIIRETKKSYYESSFRKLRVYDIRKTWDTIKIIITKTRKFKAFPQSFLINGAYISNTQIIAEEFNSYFVCKCWAFKKNEDYLLENYRPISVLPIISKVLERVMHIQLTNYFSSKNILYNHQYGFRNSHSTELASLEFVDRIFNNMDNNEIPLVVYHDLSEAFDIIDHEILLYKLNNYGIRNLSHKLIQNYFSNRKQYVSIDSVNSSPLHHNCPSRLHSWSLIFYYLYIHDLHLACR